MRRHLFTILWVAIAVSLAVLSFYFKDGTEAMVAQVESRSTAISFMKPVIIRSIKGIPGQSVKKGEVLVVVERPDLQLDMDQIDNEIRLKESELSWKDLEYARNLREVKLSFDLALSDLVLQVTELELEQSKATGIQSRLGVSRSATDSIRSIQINRLKNEMDLERETFEIQKKSMLDALDSDKAAIRNQISLLSKKRELIKGETDGMIQTAPYDGVVATIDAREGELVSPFTKVLSIYESSPTLIKAFMNEQINYEVSVGLDEVVESENRLYKIRGKVAELGARITSYPTKLEPLRNQISYGREVFIEIPPQSQFLNGEKVFVYPVTE